MWHREIWSSCSPMECVTIFMIVRRWEYRVLWLVYPKLFKLIGLICKFNGESHETALELAMVGGGKAWLMDPIHTRAVYWTGYLILQAQIRFFIIIFYPGIPHFGTLQQNTVDMKGPVGSSAAVLTDRRQVVSLVNRTLPPMCAVGDPALRDADVFRFQTGLPAKVIWHTVTYANVCYTMS